jgi:hypothetical protein
MAEKQTNMTTTKVFGHLGFKKGDKVCRVTMTSKILLRDPVSHEYDGLREIGILNDDLIIGKPINITFENAKTNNVGDSVIRVDLLDSSKSNRLALRLWTRMGSVCILEEV